MEFTPPTPETEQAQQSRSAVSWRLLILKAVLSVFFVAIAARLVVIQVLDAPRYRAIARKQYEQKFTLPAIRGNIHDRSGHVLVSNTVFLSFAADPKIVGDRDRVIANAFAQVLGKPAGHYLSKLRSDPSRRFVWLERRVHPAQAARLADARLEGVVVVKEPKRLYHYDELAAAAIGFTDIDNNGISGIELTLDQELRGTPGSVVMQRDGLGRARPSADYPRVEPVNGHHIRLTIDLSYQAILEEELRNGVIANKADGGLAVMLDPRTGEILALATAPSINPNAPGSIDHADARNRVVTDMFEPGSIFKIVTAAAAYEHDVISPDRPFNAENGLYKVILRGKVVRLIRDTHEHQTLTFQEGLEQSSNIVMAKAVDLIGSERFYRQARDFGFGIPTGVDMPGEVRGRLKKPHEWSGITMQTMAYGYEVAVTPLQIALAYAAIANGGVLMRPSIIREVRSESGDILRENHPQRVRRVVSEETATLLTRAFEGAVEHGTAQEVRIRGIRVAGKTGTARRIVDGRYAPGSYTASFVGYFPAEDPQVVCLVMMENPRARGYYGGVTSAPIFRAVAERVLQTSPRFQRTTMAATVPDDQRSITVPDVRTVTQSVAERILRGQGLTPESFGRGKVVLRQSPEPGTRTAPGTTVKLVLRDEPSTGPGGLVPVPDLRGLSVRRAVNRLIVDEFDVSLEGSGIVARQSPAPGQRVAAGSVVRLHCEPREIASAVLY